MNTELAGKFTIDSGDRVWVVYHIVDWKDPPAMTGRPRFARGKADTNLEDEGVRALAWKQEPDGSIVFCDAPVKGPARGN
jgi:hypothetical protein